jgi:hypothetical protein
LDGAQVLSFEAFDAGTDEIGIIVNGREVGTVVPTVAGQWGPRQETSLPARFLASDRNIVQFVVTGSSTDEVSWGVRNVTLGS